MPGLRNISKEDAIKMVRQRYGDRADDFLAAFAKAYPDYQPKDLLDTDFIFRPSTLEQGRLKLFSKALLCICICSRGSRP